MNKMIKLIVRVSAEHPDAETFKCLGNKIVLELDDYDYAYELTMTMLNLRDNDKFEHGDLMFFNEGILIEICK
tara:strand:- start:4120 stop:4338 length:219 start_codon:yes stop_codon:yes gene_type:complete